MVDNDTSSKAREPCLGDSNNVTTTVQIKNQTYRIAIQPPPGLARVAPKGFPADPLPTSTAPAPFLDAMKIRLAVFCDEQHCRASEELDPDDGKSWSWIAYEVHADSDHDNSNKTNGGKETAVSTIRIVPPPHEATHPNGFIDADEKPYIKVTRVATLSQARGRGLSRVLLEHALAFFAERPHLIAHQQDGTGTAGTGIETQTKAEQKWTGLVLTHAQVGVQGMYEKMGFVRDERLGVWDEEGIDHVGMWRNVQVSRS